jgi:dTDP-glucose 4,6-dehydratase
MAPDLRPDLDAVLALTGPVWPALSGARLMITGGTGFIGKWLLESLRHANRTLGTGITATILTRNPEGFRAAQPHLGEDPAFRFVAGDVAHLPPMPGGPFTLAIHGATEASAHLNVNDPLRMFDTIVDGTRAVLDWAVAQDVPRMLFLSSGGVYGPQQPDLERVPESWRGGFDCTDHGAAYGQGKRAAEALCAIFARQRGLQVVIARIFALLGPHLPLDVHFAAGNFIRDAMKGGPVIVQGDGTPFRSYLYASDLAVWLLHLLVRGESLAPVNVGSDQGIAIADLARKVADLLGPCACEVRGQPKPGVPPARYVCATDRARDQYGLRRTVSLEEAILRTARWNGWDEGRSHGQGH